MSDLLALPTTPRHTFSNKRAALHALVPVIVMVVIAGVVATTTSVANPEKFGEGTGRFAVFVFAVAYGISYLAQTGRNRAALGTGLGFAGVVVGLGILISTAGGRREVVMPASLRVPLVDDGSGRLRHPVLGFSFTKPSGMALAVELARAFPADPTQAYYVYANREAGEVLIVDVMYDGPRTQSAMQQTLDGVVHGLLTSAAGKLTLAFKDKHITWTDQTHEATATAEIDNDHELRLRAIAVEPAGYAPVVVVVVGIGPTTSTLAATLASLTMAR